MYFPTPPIPQDAVAPVLGELCISLPLQSPGMLRLRLPGLPYLEEGHGGSVSDSPVLYLGLLCQVIRRVDGGFHPLHGQEGSQVGSIG